MKRVEVRILCVLALFVFEIGLYSAAAEETAGARSGPQPPRQVTTLEYAESPPLFVTRAKTLDPLAISRNAWNGYLKTMCEPWGMMPGGKPSYRFFFDDRILPWVEMKHHGVDGFDNNNRNLGAHALLREMFGREKLNDPIEEGQLGYLLSITDPEGGLPYPPERLPRHCALGHGELAKNVMLYYEQTKEEWVRDWAEKILRTLRRYAFEREIPDVGMVAEYHQGGGGGQGGFNVGEPPVSTTADLSLDGWQHLYLGWNSWAFAKWHQMTGDPESLKFATALATRLFHSSDEAGNDGAFRPDGSFGAASGGSLHMHGHTHALPGLVLLGEQLIASGQREKGLDFIRKTQSIFEWLYDASVNPDAGSMTGWLPEFLCVKSGWDRKGDCEGCTMGDIVQAAVALGMASRLDPGLEPFVDYFDRAEQIYRGQVVESIFHVTPQYQSVLKDCLTKRVAKEMPGASEKDKKEKLEQYYQESIRTAERMEGRLLGLCGFPDWVNLYTSPLDAELPGIDMMGCCADAVIRASHAIWRHTVTGDERETRINLAFSHDSPLVQVVSCLPHRGEINIIVKESQKVLVRIPGWAPKEKVKTYIDKQPLKTGWQGSYVVFDKIKKGQQLTVVYPLRMAEVKETIYGADFVEYTEKWRGNTIVDIAPVGQRIPMFQRPQLDTETLPE